MRQRAIIFTFLRSMVLCSFILTRGKADVLSSDQKAPPFARRSGGLVLPLPLEGAPRVAGVQREEVSSFKKVGDQTIHVVEGTFAYKSPEGLPISVKYTADENGNRASFKFGTGVSSPSQVSQPGGAGPSKGGGGSSSYLPPNKNGKTKDRSYLPPN